MDKGRLNEIFNDASEAVVIFDKQGSIIYFNSTAHYLFQYTSTKAEGKSIFDLIEQEIHQELKEFLTHPTSSKHILEQKAFIIRQDEQLLPVSFLLSTITHEKGNIYMMVIEALAASEDALSLNYKLLADNVPDTVSLYNAQFNCLYVNPAVQQLYGYRQAEYIGIGGFLDLIADEDKARIHQEVEQDTQHKIALSTYTYSAYRSNGELISVHNTVKRTFDTQGKLNRLIAYEKASVQEPKSQISKVTDAALLLLDGQWKINYVSPATTSLLDIATIHGKVFTDILHPEDQHTVYHVDDVPILNGISSMQYRLRIKQEGAYQNMRVILDKFYNEKGERTHTTARLYPIHEQETIDLQAAPQYLKLIAEYVEEVVCFFKQDLTLKYISPSVKQILGYTQDELQGREIFSIIHAKDRLKAEHRFKSDRNMLDENFRCRFVTKEGAFLELELDFRMLEEPSKAGETLPFLVLLKPVAHAGALSDPADLFADVFNYLADAIALVALPSLTIQRVNTKFLEIFAASAKEAEGKPVQILFDKETNLQPLENALLNMKAFQQNIRCCNMQQTPFWANAAISFFQVEQQNFALLRISDISELKDNEERLQKARSEAERMLKTREDFLSTMSHEIRTPLNAVLGMTHLMLQGTPREDQVKLLQTLKFSGDSLTALINDVLDYSKIEAGKLEFAQDDFNLIEFLKGIKLTYKNLAQDKGLLFRTLVEEELPDMLNGDVNRLGQILNNLLSNAIKFTEDGQVILSVYVDSEKEDEYTLLFEVADTGIGIPKDKQTIIFDPYKQASQRTSRYFGGTGLGLSIVKKLVDIFGGEIDLQSHEGKGSTFKVKIPFNKVANAGSFSPQSDHSFIHEFQPLDGLKVLYVEDVIPNQFLMEGLCDTWHIQLDTALNGLEALEKVKQNHYDLILMDIQMPEMDGFEATQEIRNLKDPHYSNIPILALSASVSDGTRLRIKENGMDDYITKPINPKDLHHKLSHFSKIVSTNIVSDRAESEHEDAVLTNDVILDTPDFSQLRALYINDLSDYVKILQQILKLTQDSTATMKQALQIGHEELFRSNGHKIMSYIKLMKLQEMEEIVNSIKLKFDEYSKSSGKYIPILNQHFNYFILNLKKEIEEHSS
ncbi:PAS domain S-box protein [Catalinimonas niigatensis]|uniref:PAS domain S-box protein n=1 Tax=Catalinimonas niigatensis TaxID=1397264 RepID=UPI0026654939|nr:PAS domain S-box protein [Catalinimonas niigatensis]WPP53671.1 PAS domain S-box protein [Catalinimonas niigatensis]